MFEFNPDLVQGDDQEAGEESVLYSHQEEEEEEEEGGGREGEEAVGKAGDGEEAGRDITDMAGYSDEVVAPPLPPPVQSSAAGSSSQTEAASGIIDERERANLVVQTVGLFLYTAVYTIP